MVRPRQVLDVNHQIGPRAGATEKHMARIRRIQGLEGIVGFAFQKLVLASVTDAGTAAKVREDPLIFGKFEQVFISGIPFSGNPGLCEDNLISLLFRCSFSSKVCSLFSS